MSRRICTNGHEFDKTSSCPVCPTCSADEMRKKYVGFPKIGAPASRALNSAGIITLNDLTKFTKEDLLALHGFGPRALKILSEALKEKGLSFAQNA